MLRLPKTRKISMTREDYVKYLIQKQNHTLKSFAASIHIPYTTLLSMLKNGLGGAAIDNVIKICNGLHITVEELQSIEDPCFSAYSQPILSEKEKLLIKHYRNMPELQSAIDKLLDLS